MQETRISDKLATFRRLYHKKIEDAIILEEKIFGSAHSEQEYYDNCKRGLQIEIRYADERKDGEVISFPVAFIVLFNRVDQTDIIIDGIPNHERKITRHIWLCGVLPEFRNRGFMKGLFYMCFSGDPNMIVPRCADDRNYESSDIIFVHTYPEYYKDMFVLLQKYGFVEEKEIVGKYKNQGRCVRYVTTFEKIRKIMNASTSLCLAKLN